MNDMSVSHYRYDTTPIHLARRVVYGVLYDTVVRCRYQRTDTFQQIHMKLSIASSHRAANRVDAQKEASGMNSPANNRRMQIQTCVLHLHTNCACKLCARQWYAVG